MQRSFKTTLLALVDQSVYALTSLAVQVFIARSTSPDEFGAYTVASTFFLAAAVVHQTCIVEPMFVFSGQRFGDHVVQYQAGLRRGWSLWFGIACAVVGAALAVAARFAGSASLEACLWAFSVATPFLLLLWLQRRMALQAGRIGLAVAGGLLYVAFLVPMIAGLHLSSLVSGVSITLATGMAAALAALAVTVTGGWQPPPAEKVPLDALRQHVRYGRWALASELVNWLVVNGPILVLPALSGFGASALLRVVNLTLMPLLQIGSVLMMLLLRRLSDEGDVSRSSELGRSVAGVAALCLIYAACLVAFAPLVAPLVFGRGYELDRTVLAAAAAYGFSLVTIQPFFTYLRAAERTDLVLAAHLVVLVATAILVALAIPFGVLGIYAAQATAWTITLLLTALIVRRRTSLRSRGPDAEA